MDEKLRKYFLGTLSPDEIREIELRLISDASFEEDLIQSRENLMEDYLDEMLSPGEVEKFRTNFLSCEKRMDELKNLAALKTYARRQLSTKNAPEQVKSSSAGFFEKFTDFIRVNIRPIAAAAVILIAVFAGYIFLIPESNELAELNSRNLQNIEEFRDLTNFSLIPGTLRGSDRISELSADKLTDTVFLRLALPLEGEIFDVNITGNDKKIVSGLRVRSYSNQNGQEIRLLLPSAALSSGDYKIEVFPADTANTPVTYSFTVR